MRRLVGSAGAVISLLAALGLMTQSVAEAPGVAQVDQQRLENAD